MELICYSTEVINCRSSYCLYDPRELASADFKCSNYIFRFFLSNYPERGLADDRFWFNGQMRLYETLFWITYAVFFGLPNCLYFAKLQLEDLFFENNIG